MKNLKLFLATAVLSTCAIAANELPLRTDLNEKVLMIPVDKTFYGGDISLETTLFKPDGDGPFPLVIINDGKSLGNPSFQDRSRYSLMATEFLKRGYAVALPMQRGFSKSGGSNFYLEGCNSPYGAALKQAADVRTVIAHFAKTPEIDTKKVIVAGQSFGGLGTMALASDAPDGVKLLLNFAGGLKYEGCQWESTLKYTFEKLGENAKTPSLWFYGENDSFFPPELSKQLYSNFNKTNASAEMISFGKFRGDAHGMFGTREGFDSIWWPVVEKKLISLNMPTAIIHPQYDSNNKTESTGYAQIDQLEKLPEFTRPKCKEKYASFIKETAGQRVFAIAENGGCGFSWGEDDKENQFMAMNYCERVSKGTPCQLYLVDDKVVWPNS
ncbi:dienelactone hydrolase family protein [Deefgea rivuli]|uniref:dienelactone hydrolase family protein n=1 Tax=Deefgea rivuli TaxID=400948 RepID=UPI00068469D9|nr:alpha/beta hydrolase [Deefgea rivuli]